jgi:hypothetical protein
MMEVYKTITVVTRKGEVGNTEWWTKEDWEAHRKYVEELKASGEYLKEETHTVTFKPFPPFDGNTI